MSDIVYEDVEELLPNRQTDECFDADRLRVEVAEDAELNINKKLTSKELNALKLRERNANKNKEIYGHESKEDYNMERAHERRREALEAARGPMVIVSAEDAKYAGTTRPEVVKLLSKLNINLNIQLSRTDTYNLLAVLLTANETQLKALQNNPKIPVAIKTVIKRILADSAVGNIEVIERLWDRIFGKQMMSLEMPQGYDGVIPNQPVSREAYVLIRETLIGRG